MTFMLTQFADLYKMLSADPNIESSRRYGFSGRSHRVAGPVAAQWGLSRFSFPHPRPRCLRGSQDHS